MGASEGFAALGLLCFLGASVALAAVDLRHRRIPNRIVVPSLIAMLALFAAAAVAHGVATGEWLAASAAEPGNGPGLGSGSGSGMESGAAAGSAPVFWPPAIPAVPWLGETLGGAAAAFAVALALWLLQPGAFGGGDVKAAPLAGGALGFVAGWSAVLWGFVLAAALAGILAGGMLVRERSRARRSGARSGSRDAPVGAPAALPFAPVLFAAAWAVLLIDAGSVVVGTLT